MVHGGQGCVMISCGYLISQHLKEASKIASSSVRARLCSITLDLASRRWMCLLMHYPTSGSFPLILPAHTSVPAMMWMAWWVLKRSFRIGRCI